MGLDLRGREEVLSETSGSQFSTDVSDTQQWKPQRPSLKNIWTHRRFAVAGKPGQGIIHAHLCGHLTTFCFRPLWPLAIIHGHSYAAHMQIYWRVSQCDAGG